MRVIVATKNAGKVREFKQILTEYGFEVISQSEADIEADVCETGATFIENALIKAKAISLICDDAVIADDSGLCVPSLNGEPGVYSARYSGVHGYDAANNNKLLKNLADKADRSAYFECAIALVLPDGTEITSTGRAYGKILDAPDGCNGFGYDPLFYSDDLNKSFGTADNDEKNSVSHRGRALEELCKKLDKYQEGTEK